ncbi:MAG: TlpA family protein disulfide reductase [Clostridia bacterium]|nr:TlpA family protein disulfide reductase [Clostridia bacterium]
MSLTEKIKNFWNACKTPKGLQIIAWTLASVVLAGSLVYYNFIDKPLEGKKKGDGCPDFTLSTFEIKDKDFQLSDKTFRFSDHKGKVLVLNFWATNCQPCKEEIPHFNELYENYASDVEVVIINGQGGISPENLVQFMNGNAGATSEKEYQTYYQYWEEFTCTFARYEPSNNDVLSMFAVTPALPVTVVVDRQGLIAELIQGSITYERLEGYVTPLI